jgi:hypothetical protein
MKRIQMAPGSNGGKMTILLFQIEGNDQTLQDGIKTISDAIDGMVRPARALPAAVPNGASSQRSTAETLDTAEPSPTKEQEFALEPLDERAEIRRSPKPPKVLPELKVPVEDLRKVLDEYKVPDQDNSRYLALAFFLRENMSVPAVTMDHIYTCYRLLGWTTPKDAGQPLRRLKSQGFFEKGDDAGAYVLNHVGENAILKMKGE